MDDFDLERRPLFVMHIPKTAGTSLVWVLMHQVAPDSLYKIYPGKWSQFESLRQQARIAVPRMIVGHYRFGLHDGICPNPRYFTLFRDPVDRVLSHFNHLIASDDPEHRAIVQPGDRIEVFLRNEWARNLQTQYVTNLSAQEIEDDPEAAYQRAVQILHHHFASFGVAERFSESLRPLVNQLGGRMPSIPRMNQSRGLTRRDLDCTRLAKILEINRCDARLHAYAGAVLRANRSQQRAMQWGWLTSAWQRLTQQSGIRPTPVVLSGRIGHVIDPLPASVPCTTLLAQADNHLNSRGES